MVTKHSKGKKQSLLFLFKRSDCQAYLSSFILKLGRLSKKKFKLKSSPLLFIAIKNWLMFFTKRFLTTQFKEMMVRLGSINIFAPTLGGVLVEKGNEFSLSLKLFSSQDVLNKGRVTSTSVLEAIQILSYLIIFSKILQKPLFSLF